MEKFWVFLDREIHGPYDIPTLWTTSGFSETTKVCREGADEWFDAKTFLSIMNYARGLSDGKGDFEPVGRKHKNWRDAVIPVGFESAPSRTALNANVSAFMLDTPAVSRVRSINPRNLVPRFFKDRRDKSLLMVFLWLIAVQVYSSHWGDASMLYQNLSIGPIQEYGPVRNYSTHPNRGRVKFFSRIHNGIFAAPAIVEPISKQAPSKPAKTTSKTELVDQSTEDLGNGMMMKVTVVMTERHGVKTYETRRQYFQLDGRRWKPM